MSRRTVVATADSEEVWDSQVIASRLRGARALRHVLRFDDVRLHLDNLDEALSPRPIIAARLLSRGRALMQDGQGRVRVLGWVELARVAADALRMQFAWPEALRAVKFDLAALAQPLSPCAPGGDGVLVVRTDLWFGLEAGGAVAHAIGMLNALSECAGPVRLLSAHQVPMLTPAIEQIAPAWRPFGRAERTLLAFNRDLIAAAERLPRPRFVYQRFGLYGYAGAASARYWRVPFVLEYNGSEVWIGDHWGQPVAARDTALEIERRMLAAAHIVTVVSKPLIEQAVERGAVRERVLLVPNAVDTVKYHPAIDGGPVRARYNLGDALVIGFIGTFGQWHGAPLLAEAFAALKQHAPGLNVRLLMIGDGPQLSAARRIIDAASLADAVVFTGLVPQAEGPTHLAAADILVSPTMPSPDGREFFGSPTKLFEYMAMGRAIVMSDMAQMAEVFERGRTALLTEPGDPAQLTLALERLCEDDALRRRLGENARAEAEAHHTWDRRVHSVLAALQAVT